MEINKDVLIKIDNANLSRDIMLFILTSIYFKIEITFMQNVSNYKQSLINIGLLDSNDNILVPLFNDLQNDDNEVKVLEDKEDYSWIKDEYVPLFKAKNKKKGGYVRESTLRMKKLFKEMKSLNKDIVLNATRAYLKNTDADYIRFPHYFILKGSGYTSNSDLLSWIDTIKESENDVINDDKKSVKDKMQ